MNKRLLALLLATLAVSGWLFLSDQKEAVQQGSTAVALHPQMEVSRIDAAVSVQRVVQSDGEGEVRDLFPERHATSLSPSPSPKPSIEPTLPPVPLPPPIKYLGRKLDGKNDRAILEVNGIPQMYQKGDMVESNWKLEDFGPNELVLKDMRDQSLQRLNMGS